MLRPGRARADVVLLEDRDVGDAVLASQVVGGRQAVRAAADDDDVVGVLELRARAPHPALAEDVTHGGLLRTGAPIATSSSASTPTGAPPSARRVGDRLPHVLRRAPAPNSTRKRSSPSRTTMPGVRATEPGRKRPDRRDLRAQVQRRRSGRTTSRASGPTSVSAAYLLVASTTLTVADASTRLLRRSRRPASAAGSHDDRALAGQRQPPGVGRARRARRARASRRRPTGDDRRQVVGG